MIDSLYKPFQHWSEKNAIWIISDLHFGEDEDLREAYPNRPSAEEMIKTINQKVGRNGTLLVLGDAGLPEYVSQLKGYKVLIKGNHEPGLQNFTNIFDEVYEGMLIIHPHIILSHEPIAFPYAYNIHGHNHNGQQFSYGSMNVCADVIGYTPVNFNQFIKSGKLKECIDIHRKTIDTATDRKKKHLNIYKKKGKN